MDKNIVYKDFAKSLRRLIIKATYDTGRVGVHLGPALSVADFIAVMYGGKLNVTPSNATDDNRDRFILSKGHAYTALYAALALKGYFTEDTLKENFMTDGGFLPAHPIKNLPVGIECSSGSLGMGLSYAIGKALNAKKKNLGYTTYVVMGDGECDEGSTWEAFMSAVQYQLNNLVVFIDHNHLQHDGNPRDVMNIPFADVLKAWGWEVASIDGNDVDAIVDALDRRSSTKPFAIVGNTIKGKGISFMENDNAWHHAHITEEQFNQCMDELM